ncbi:hypothetical protein Forpe1208_v012077 [Fusarium oxysporum f. sp. rapae]|uniref:Uncharacterized protein n=1 Tax=Fusarium oxysporum f. sp. rapae TaxID=485398 RepID=A0A8J5NNW1_FUSOX|nr:hypothetical protein Forpe1208_v012077 [Fusarium oxysporum f. sp. rapae]
MFHPSNGYSEHWRQDVKPKEENQPHVVDMRIPPAANSTKHDAAIEVAIHFVQDHTFALPNGELRALYQFKLRFISATMSTVDKIVRFASPGEVLQVEKSEQNGDPLLQGWELVDADDRDSDVEDYQAFGRKGRTVGDLINDIRWFCGKDPILYDSNKS